MQRVAIARALITDPPLLADEPTGNLDSSTGVEILEVLQEISTRRTVVIVTHDERAAGSAEPMIHLRDGLISGEIRLTGDRDPATLASQLVRLEV